jgi:hypothetical protein
MIEIINIHHVPHVTYDVDRDGNIVAIDLYPHKVVRRVVNDTLEPRRAEALAEKLNIQRRAWEARVGHIGEGV